MNQLSNESLVACGVIGTISVTDDTSPGVRGAWYSAGRHMPFPLEQPQAWHLPWNIRDPVLLGEEELL
jgi:hypothetical protein